MQRTQKPPTLAEYLMIGIVKPLIKKPLFGKQKLPMGAYLSVGGFLFEQGAVLGWLFKDKQIQFIQVIDLPYPPEERIARIRLAAKERVEKCKSSQDSFYLFVYETELDRLGHPINMITSDWIKNQHFDIDKAWNKLHFLFYEGIGYGFEFPEETKQQWESVYEKVKTTDEVKIWRDAYKCGVVTTPEPSPIQKWDERVSELETTLRHYIVEYKPELIYIVDEQ